MYKLRKYFLRLFYVKTYIFFNIRRSDYKLVRFIQLVTETVKKIFLLR